MMVDRGLYLDVPLKKGKQESKRKSRDDGDIVAKVYIDEYGDYWVVMGGNYHLMGESGMLLVPRAKPQLKMRFLFKVNGARGKWGEIKWDEVMERINKHRKRRRG
jgi:hypothetical protein